MRVLFISRATLFQVIGGDTVQMEQTAENLRKLGVHVDIRLADDPGIPYETYDLIHAFNIIRPADILHHISRSDLPLIVSPIYVEYGKAANTEYNPALKWLMNKIGPNRGEYLKWLGRVLLKHEKIQSFQYLYWGHRKSIHYILKKCRALLPNSESEYRRLKNDFPVSGAYRVVPNAVDTKLFHAHAGGERTQGVICAARFEPRKNQLNVIRALNNTEFEVTFVGEPAPNHQRYYDKCRAAAAPNIRFMGFVPQEQLAGLYRKNKVHVLASWFETTGLSSLEAAACGCNVVITAHGDTRDYFGVDGYYCDPADPGSILEKVRAAAKAPANEAFLRGIEQNFCWEQTAAETLKTYRDVLGL